MEENKSKKGLIIVIIALVVLVLGLGGYLLYDKVLSKDKPINTDTNISDNKQDDTELKTISITDDIQKLYNNLVINDGQFGFYFNKSVTINDIDSNTFLRYVFNQYIEENNIKTNATCIECYESRSDKPKSCKKITNDQTISKSVLDDYIKSHYNTDRVFTTHDVDYDQPSEYVQTTTFECSDYGYECLYDSKTQKYAFGKVCEPGDGSFNAYLWTKLTKVEEDKNSIYFYDQAIYCSDDIICSISISEFDPYDEEGKSTIEYIDNPDEDAKNSKIVNYNNEDYTLSLKENAFEKAADKLHTYKHTFKKSNDGKYYWYSSELVK